MNFVLCCEIEIFLFQMQIWRKSIIIRLTTYVQPYLEEEILSPKQFDGFQIELQQVEIASRSLYRVNYYKQLIHFIRIITARFVIVFSFLLIQPSIRLTAHTCEMVMESIIGSKQYDLLDLMWNLVDHDLRSHWSILGTLLYCM